MTNERMAGLSCLASNHAWRREANALRDLADQTRLSRDERAALRRRAEAADSQADMWLEGAIATHCPTAPPQNSYHERTS